MSSCQQNSFTMISSNNSNSSYITKLGKGKPLSGQTKEVLLNVYDYVKKSRETHGENIDVLVLIDEVSKATGISQSSIKLVVYSNKNSGKEEATKSPKIKRNRPNTIQIDSFDECVIRRCIYDLHINKKVLPTIPTLLPILRESINFSGGETKLREVVKSIGFKWHKTKDNSKILQEKFDIMFKRIAYLRAIKRYREERRPIVYTDETYVHTSHVSSRGWSDNSNEGLRKPISKGSRFIIVYAGGENGFLPNCLFIYKSHQTTGDYHNDMNFDNYRKWLMEKLIPNLDPRSVVVTYDALYHNKVIDPAPNSSTNKADMMQWLTGKNIPFSNDMLKPELYKLITCHKNNFKEFAIDRLLREHGHDVLRLPPCHPDLNPFEKICASLKEYVGSRNLQLTLNTVDQLVKEKVSLINSEEWSRICSHVKDVESEYWEREIMFDHICENHNFISLSEASDSDSSSD